MSDDTTPTLPPSGNADDFYQYAERAQTALLDMVRNVLHQVAQDGLVGEHHFYLTYYTQSEGVALSDKMRAAHPEEITIVLQNQFEDLEVDDDAFRVTLSFNNQAERLVVPFKALSKFYDPSVAFGLMFDVEPPFTEDAKAPLEEKTGLAEDGQKGALKPDGASGEVVSLDSFRDK
jgi:hypothetical protein